MAKYEKTRKYLVTKVNKKNVVLEAPKGRAFHALTFPTKSLVLLFGKTPMVGQKVICDRVSNRQTTFYTPAKLVNR